MRAALCAMASCETELALGDVLDRISRELISLEGMMREMYPIVEMLVAETDDFNSILAMQNIDRIEQTLTGLSSFMQAIATDAPADWKLDVAPAAGVLGLSDLAHRLSTQNPHQPKDDTADAGDCEMF